MNWDLYDKYGEYNKDGFYIENLELWHFYAQRPKLYRRKKIKAYLWLLIPLMGIIFCTIAFEDMGLSLI